MLYPGLEAVVVGRVRVGLIMVLLGAAGLAAGWQIEENGDDVAVLAVLAALAIAGGCLLAVSARGELAVRTTGGLLFAAGLAVAVTDRAVWWWLPGNWQIPVSAAALLISLAGLGVLLLAYGVSRAGVSGALGLVALACLLFALLPYIGSNEQATLRAFATALGAVALTTGMSAAQVWRSRFARRVTTTAVAVTGAAVVVYTGYDSYGQTPPGGFHAAVIAATIIGAVATLALGATVWWPGLAGELSRKGPGSGREAGPEAVVPPASTPEQAHEPPSQVGPSSQVRLPSQVGPLSYAEPPLRAELQPERLSPMPAELTPPPTAAEPVTTPVAESNADAVQPSPTTAASAASAAETVVHPRDRLQTVSLAVGLILGLITIVKEVIAAALALIH